MRRRERHVAIGDCGIGHSLVIGHCVIGHFTRLLVIDIPAHRRMSRAWFKLSIERRFLP